MASDAMTKSFSLTFAEDLANEFLNDNLNQYFLYFGKIDSWENSPYSTTSDGGNETPASNSDTVEFKNYAKRDAVVAKRISSRNTYRMVPRNNWTYGTIYDKFDHTVDMHDGTKKFFVYTSTGNIYKCIGNNSSGTSQYEPDHTNTPVVSYSDGYKWKFICKVLEDANEFITESYLPVKVAQDNSENILNQWTAQQNAVNGSIDIISVQVPTSGHTAASWIKSSSSAVDSETQDNEVGESSAIGDTSITISSTDDSTDDFYNGYAIYISSGPGVGQRRVIKDYDGANRKVFFTTPLISTVTKSQSGVQGSRYKIIPNIVIDGDGVSAEAIPQLNSNYSITNLTMINSGKDYTIADVSVYPTAVSGGEIGTNSIAGPTFSAIIPPVGGHASDVVKELGATKVMIKTVLSGSDSNFTPAQDFRQVSIVKNPTLLGGTTDGDVAGTEISRKKQLTVERPYYMTEAFNNSAFQSGNSIMGEVSKATGKIESWIPDVGGSIGTLELTDVRGTFDIENPASTLTRIVFTNDSQGNTGQFVVGNIVKQTKNSITAVGKIKEWSAPSGGPYELIVDVTSNSFVENASVQEYDSTGTSTTGVDWLNTTVVENKTGELIKHYSSTQGTTFEFKTFTTNEYQNIARAKKITDVQDEETLEKSYRLTTKLIIEDSTSSLSSSSYTKDADFYQITLDTGLTGSTVQGKIVDWNVTSGATGELFLNDVRGSFVAGGFSGSANHSITTISQPEFKIGSGEVLYIQNIRPVTRSVEQDEEIKIMIGF